MDCQFPHHHKKLLVASKSKKNKSVKQTIEDGLSAPYFLPCPQITFDNEENPVLMRGETFFRPLPELTALVNHTHPVPLFDPFFAQCGQGPFPESMLAKRKEVDYGGNICSVSVNNEVYLIHSTLGECGDGFRSNMPVSLGLSRVTEADAGLLKVGRKMDLINGGIIYQIAKSRKLGVESDDDHFFATRQAQCGRLWKIEANVDHGTDPIIKLVHEKTDQSAALKSVDVSPDGEYCELRSGKLICFRDGFEYFGTNVEKNFKYCLYRYQPHQLLLGSDTSISLIDTRSNSSRPLPLLSMGNENLQTYWNLPAGERILSFTPSLKEQVSYGTTESSVLVWDHRFGSRVLSRTAHFKEHHPRLLTSVMVNQNQEWVFFESETPYSSSMLAIEWSDDPWIHRSVNKTSPTASEFMLPTSRKTLGDTIRQLQKTESWAMDWSLRNRLQQSITGLTSRLDRNGNILIWNCTAAGDIFVQTVTGTKAAGDKLANQLNKVEAAEGSCDQQVNETIIVEQDQITSGEFLKKMKMWAGKLSEEAANQVLPRPQVQRIMEFPDICKEWSQSVSKSKEKYRRLQDFSIADHLPPSNLKSERRKDPLRRDDPNVQRFQGPWKKGSCPVNIPSASSTPAANGDILTGPNLPMSSTSAAKRRPSTSAADKRRQSVRRRLE